MGSDVPCAIERLFRPGYVNFQKVAPGEVLAAERGEEVRAVEGGRLLLPLYQALGNDGFFLAREFHSFWLGASSLLRRAGVDRFAHFLPGVRKARNRKGVLLVSPLSARCFVIEFFHLLGYRKLRRGENYWIISRRRHEEIE